MQSILRKVTDPCTQPHYAHTFTLHTHSLTQNVRTRVSNHYHMGSIGTSRTHAHTFVHMRKRRICTARQWPSVFLEHARPCADSSAAVEWSAMHCMFEYMGTLSDHDAFQVELRGACTPTLSHPCNHNTLPRHLASHSTQLHSTNQYLDVLHSGTRSGVFTMLRALCPEKCY
jgi:hypothetical protein